MREKPLRLISRADFWIWILYLKTGFAQCLVGSELYGKTYTPARKAEYAGKVE